MPASAGMPPAQTSKDFWPEAGAASCTALLRAASLAWSFHRTPTSFGRG